MSKLFQIYEEDLAELEKLCPELASALMPHLNSRLRIKLRKIQEILSQARWNYGPPSEVEAISADMPLPPPAEEVA